VVEQQKILALDVSLTESPAIWWAMHNISIQDWSQCKILFGETSKYIADKYTGMKIPKDHIVTCGYVWNEFPK